MKTEDEEIEVIGNFAYEVHRQKKDDEDQIQYLLEWNRQKKIRDEEKANKKQRKKEARRQWWKRITGGRR